MYIMSLPTKYDYNYLLVYVDGDNELKELYREKIEEHNNKVKNNPFPDAGFDLFCPKETDIYYNKRNMIDLQVKCAMYKKIVLDGDYTKRYISYYMYPRSSISKTFIRLANSTGIIDSGYRGNLCAAVDNINDHQVETAGKHQRYFQICSPTLEPLIVKLVDDISDFETTIRGSGGFGSTGY